MATTPGREPGAFVAWGFDSPSVHREDVMAANFAQQQSEANVAERLVGVSGGAAAGAPPDREDGGSTPCILAGVAHW